MGRRVIILRPDLSAPPPLAKDAQDFIAQQKTISVPSESAPPVNVAATRKLWFELHSTALNEPEKMTADWLEDFARRVPCGACKQHWREWTSQNPFDPQRAFEWSVHAHNSVNSRLLKKTLTSEEAKPLYQVKEK